LLDHAQFDRLVTRKGLAKMKRNLGRLVIALILVAGLGTTRPAAASDFDFYVLSLSWSPTWCAANDRDGQTPQCDGKRRYGLIVHGFWPQYEHGFPQDCPSSEPDRVPGSLLRGYYDIIPSAGLAGHEWRKHGTCSGLSQQRYFSLLRAAFSKIKLPPVIFNGSINRNLKTGDVEDLMTSFNPGMTQDGISVICDKGKLSEIRICMTKSLDYRACGEVDRQSCNKSIVTLPGILKEKIE
jgi:ribonuclease T2